MTNFPTETSLLQSVLCVLNVIIELYNGDLESLNVQLRIIEDKEDSIEETKYRFKQELRNIHHEYNDLEDKVIVLENKENITEEETIQIGDYEKAMDELNTRRLSMSSRVRALRDESVQVSKESDKLELDYDRTQQNILSLQHRVVSIQSQLKGTDKLKKKSRPIRQSEHEETKEIDHNDMFSLKKSRT